MTLEALLSRFATRFVWVDVVPGFAAVGMLWLILVSGAPNRRPSIASVGSALGQLDLPTVLLLLGVSIIIGVVLHPLQYAMVQLLEGYWAWLPHGPALTAAGRRRYKLLSESLNDILAGKGPSELITELREVALLRRRWIPSDPSRIMPTSLGNVLRAGEDRAGARYGLGAITVTPLLFTHLSPGHAAQLTDQRNQMDAAVRLTYTWLVLSLIAAAILVRYDIWLLTSFVLYLLAWLSYRAAVAASRGFMNSLAAAFDEHRWQVYEALHLALPKNLVAERALGKLVTRLMLEGELLSPGVVASVLYSHPSGLPSTESKALRGAL